MFLFWIILINRNCGDSIITFGFYCIQFIINYLQATKICALTRIFNLNSFLLLKFYSHNHHSFFIMTSPGWIRTSECRSQAAYQGWTDFSISCEAHYICYHRKSCALPLGDWAMMEGRAYFIFLFRKIKLLLKDASSRYRPYETRHIVMHWSSNWSTFLSKKWWDSNP